GESKRSFDEFRGGGRFHSERESDEATRRGHRSHDQSGVRNGRPRLYARVDSVRNEPEGLGPPFANTRWEMAAKRGSCRSWSTFGSTAINDSVMDCSSTARSSSANAASRMPSASSSKAR